MGYTQFYNEVRNAPEKITWKDIFSEFRNKHTQKDMEYALLAGTLIDQTNESNMLQKWRKPWLFWRVFLAGCAISILVLLAIVFGGENDGTMIFAYVVIPMIVPLALMILFWELNIPRNISFYMLFGCFLVGGLLCFFVTGLLFQVVPGWLGASIGAPLREEPAKLAASVLLLYWFAKTKGKLYGLTGLVIGAAVGTGFSAFESVSYGVQNGLYTVFLRMLTAVAGHTLYSAPYAAAVALHADGSGLSAKSFLNQDFWFAFLCAVGTHMFWNSSLLGNAFFFKLVISVVITWSVTLRMVRKCMQQAVSLGASAQAAIPYWPPSALSNARPRPQIVGVAGYFKGCSIPIPEKGVQLGRDASCAFQFPSQNARGISRKHSMIRFDPQRQVFWLYDLGSTYGTFLKNGQRIPPNTPAALHSGDVFFLAQNTTMFRVQL